MSLYELKIRDLEKKLQEQSAVVGELVTVISDFHEAAKKTQFEYEVNDLWQFYYERIEQALAKLKPEAPSS